MLDLQKRRVQLMLSIMAIIVLSMTAEKFRELVGEEAASKSGKFTFLNCFDLGSGSVACGAKESVKLYVYNLRGAHVERVRQRAIEKALSDALSEGLAASEAAKQAQKIGANAAKLATRQAKRIVGPIISSGWDFFEAVYFGGTFMEGFLRGAGTLFGTYVGGYHGEQWMGKLGYLTGSHFGSWVGGRLGLMIYDVANGVHFLYSTFQWEEPEARREENSYSEEHYKTSRETTDDNIFYGRESSENQYHDSMDEKSEESSDFSLF